MNSKRFLALSIGLASLHHGLTNAENGASGDDLGFLIEEIVVTAQRREQNLQDIPVSVQALSESALEDRNLNTLQQLSLASPGLQLGQDNTFAMRGVGTLVFTQTVDSSVAIAMDEVNLGRPMLAGSVFNDIERIEVLSGPQGLLFGRNASAGLMNIVTTRPKLETTEGHVDAEYGMRSSTPDDGAGWITKGYYNLPLSERSALRINAHIADQEPVARHNGQTGSADPRIDEDAEQFGLKVKYLHEFSDDLELYVIADYTQEEGVAGIFDRSYRSLGEGSINAEPLSQDSIVAGDENLEYAGDGDFFRDIDSGGLQAQVTYALSSGMELSNITAWKFFDQEQALDIDYTSSHGASVNTNSTEYDQYSNETRLLLNDGGDLTGQMGVYLSYSRTQSEGQVAGNNYFPDFLLPEFPFCVGAEAIPGSFPPVCSASNDYFLGTDNVFEMESQSAAIFGQFDYALSEQDTLIVGARVTYDKIEIEGVQNQGAYFAPLGIATQYGDEVSNTDFSWKLGYQRHLDESAMVYATLAKGYKGPGFNEGLASPIAELEVEEETSTSLELGLKSSWLDRRLVVNVAAFRQEFKDYQSQSFDPIAASFVVQNAGELTTQGLELAITAMPVERLKIDFSGVFLDSEFDDFPGVQCYASQSGCDIDENGNRTFNAKGLNTPLAADFTGTLQAYYEFSLAQGLDGFVEANWYHRSPINFKVNGAPGAEIGTVNQFGASFGVTSVDGWNLSVFCKNCTDEIVPAFIDLDGGDSFNGVDTYVQAWGFNSVRTVGINVGLDF
ncbi:TonB-dependent receptor [Pseudomaricurvus alkylphenolicus]|uniref:TonB-dependent receptor n=1 Tax=Pseudomaricurvus alkylphenolicus TaxID=1306991 RepID=UPI00141DE374|nr:TonB-dependent receptor [Pseudomaricurvus alkylphenolicus]NIB43433.1 TonB-dependent receptor [Pseudomaricurvus alkylphenolicus]